MEYDLPRQIFLHYFRCVLYATAYVTSSYLVRSTCEVRKLKFRAWARLVKRPDDKCLCTSLSQWSVLTQWLGQCHTGFVKRVSRLISPWYHIFALVYPGNGSALVQVMDGHLFGGQAITQNHPDLLSIAHLDRAGGFRQGAAYTPE